MLHLNTSYKDWYTAETGRNNGRLQLRWRVEPQPIKTPFISKVKLPCRPQKLVETKYTRVETELVDIMKEITKTGDSNVKTI